MTAVTAIKTDLRREIMRILKEDIPYQVQSGDGGGIIQPTSVVFQKTRLQKNRKFEEDNQTADTPGLVLCNPFRTSVPPSEGEVGHDIWHYHWLIQGIDQEIWENEGRIATWEKWVEQIVSVFMFGCLNGAVSLPKAQIWWSTATPVSDIDETRWIRESKFITGIELEVKVSHTRGVIA